MCWLMSLYPLVGAMCWLVSLYPFIEAMRLLSWRPDGSVGVVVAQLVSATVHWVTQFSSGFESRMEPPTEGTLRQMMTL